MKGAEPFRFDAAGDLACVLVHGFTGTAHELRDLGRHLAEQGITARGVLLSGHGTSPEAMARHSYHDWLSDVESALDELTAEGKRVALCGLSMGGTLALNLAARRRSDRRLLGVVALAAPMRLVDWRLAFLPMIGWALRWQNWGDPDIKDRAQWERHVAYRRFHVRALRELLQLMRETRRLLPSVGHPVLVVHSRADNTVPVFNAPLIVDSVSSSHRKLVWLDDCYHVITLDFEADRVNQEVASFILEQA